MGKFNSFQPHTFYHYTKIFKNIISIYLNHKYINVWFTLVELIVVITILAILWTISFVSLWWFSTYARNSVRIADVNDIKESLELYSLKVWQYPDPTNAVSVTYLWWEAWLQWTIWDKTIWVLPQMSKKPIDPLAWNEYTYSVLNTRTEYQLWTIQEWWSLVYNVNPTKVPWKEILWSLLINKSDNSLFFMSKLIQQTKASWENRAQAYIIWNYNWQILKVSTGSIDYILAVPSIIATDTTTNLQTLLNNKLLSYTKYSSLPSSYNNKWYTMTGWFNYGPINAVVYSWSTLALSSSGTLQEQMVDNLKLAYQNTQLSNDWNISQIINTTTPAAKQNLMAVIINNWKWWILWFKVDTSANSSIAINPSIFYSQNLNHKFEKISWSKLDIITEGDNLVDNNYIFYKNSIYLYRANKDWTNKIKLRNNIISSFKCDMDNDYIFYTNMSDWNKLYRINKDGTNDIKLNNVSSLFFKSYWSDIFYSNLWLNKINKDGTNNIKLNSDIISNIVVDQNYVFYEKGNFMGIWELWRINKDWTNNIKLTDEIYGDLLLDNNYIFFRKSNPWWGGFRKINKDWTWETTVIINTYWIRQPYITDNYIYFNSLNDWNNLYKINKDWTWKTKITDCIMPGNDDFYTYGDNDFIYYPCNNTPGYWIYDLYKISKTNPEWFSMLDWEYKSDKITNTGTWIYINIDSTLPSWTSYTFELANQLTQQIVIPEWDRDVTLMSNRLSYFWMNYNLTSLFSVWDIIKLYKTWQSDIEVTISSVNSWELRFTTSPWVIWSWWVKKWSSNFKLIPNNKLNGSTLINLQDEFWITTNDLFYRINLNTTDITKTPVINSINISK